MSGTSPDAALPAVPLPAVPDHARRDDAPAERATEREPLARESRAFGAEPVSVRDARRMVREFLARHGADALLDASELALSEVVTNAVLHARTPLEVTLVLETDCVLRVEVADHSPRLPSQRGYSAQATTGRGMDLVAALTQECGVLPDARGGKTVWFVVGAVNPSATADPRTPHWTVPQEGRDGGKEATSRVVLLGMPPTLWLAAREHHEALLRELALYGADHPQEAVAVEQLTRADRGRTWISDGVLRQLDSRSVSDALAHRALPHGHPRPARDTPPVVDVELEVPADAAAVFDALQEVLDTAERLAVADLLLARPGLPEVVEVRDWACDQAVAQLGGVAPFHWSGPSTAPAAERSPAKAAPEFPDWDSASVTTSSRGVVAADDANRIIAVSATLAAFLGWEPSDLVGRRVVTLIPPELREAHVAGFTRHLTTGEAHVIDVPLRLPVIRADGTRVECDVLIEQTPAKGGRHVYVAWISPPEPSGDGPTT